MTKARRIFHCLEGDSPYGLDEALAADGHAEFYVGPVEASRLAFTLSRAGSGILVYDDDGRHVATFADPVRAVAHGYSQVDQAPLRLMAHHEGGGAPMTKSYTPDRPAVRYDPPDRFIRALAAGAVAEMYDGPLEAPHLAFLMRSGGNAIHIVTPQGEIVGVFATALAAATYGFRRLDHEAEQQQPSASESRSRRQRSRKVDADG